MNQCVRRSQLPQGWSQHVRTCERVAALGPRIDLSLRSCLGFCFVGLNLLLLTELRDNVADALIAVALADAFQDILDTVDDLLCMNVECRFILACRTSC